MINRFRERKAAEQLQKSLESYERALASGEDPEKARAEISGALGDHRDHTRMFMLATGLAATAAPIPEPKAAKMFAQRLRHAKPVRRRRTRVAPRFSFAPIGVAASVLAAVAILVPSFSALPGDALYAVKGASEDARVWLATGRSEARIRLGLADERLEEVETLLARSRFQAAGPGLVAAGAADSIEDPELARLIESTLQEAGKQLEAAAEILTRHPGPAEELDELVAISQRGQTLAVDIARDLPTVDKPPVFQTAVKLAKLEAKAKAARTEQRVAEPTLQPCATPSPTPPPTPTPTPSPTPDESGKVEVFTSPPATESPTASPIATEDPEATPCATAEPTPTPTSTPTSEPTTDPSAEPSPTDETDGMGSSSEGQDVEVSDQRDSNSGPNARGGAEPDPTGA